MQVEEVVSDGWRRTETEGDGLPLHTINYYKLPLVKEERRKGKRGNNDKEMKILGMRVGGAHASTAIQAIGLLVKLNMSIEVLSELIHPHPSIVEGIQECVRMLLNRSIFKSSVFKDKLACYSLVDGVKTPLERL